MPRADHGRCYNCQDIDPQNVQSRIKRFGHKAFDCPYILRCRRCGEPGHKERECQSSASPNDVLEVTPSTEQPISSHDELEGTNLDDLLDDAEEDVDIKTEYSRLGRSAGFVEDLDLVNYTRSKSTCDVRRKGSPIMAVLKSSSSYLRTKSHRRRTVESPGVHWAVEEDEDASLVGSLLDQLPKSQVEMLERRCTQGSLLDSAYSGAHTVPARSTLGGPWWEEDAVGLVPSPPYRRSVLSSTKLPAAPAASPAPNMMYVATGVPRDECLYFSQVADEPHHIRNASIRQFQACTHVQGQPMWLPHPIMLQQDPGAFVTF